MSDRLTLASKILELNENSNDIYMTVKLCILSNQVNYNNALFTDDFIQGVIDNKSKYIGIPLVANKVKLENGVYDNLTHEYSNGELNTDIIGSFIDFWEETDESNAKLLMGEARIFKRFPSVCEAIVELYKNSDLEFSCEVLISSYENVEDGVRRIHYNDGNNALIASCVVSEPAESRSRATLLIAEAYEKDLNNLREKGDVEVSKQLVNKGQKVKYHIENSELSLDDIRDQIYNLLNPTDPETEERKYRYWIRELFQTYVIIEDWNETDKLYKVSYTVEDEKVTIAPESEWIQVELTYQPINVDLNSLVSEKEKEINELQDKLNKSKEDLELMSEQNKEKTQELESKVAELQEKIDELNALLVSEKESKVELEEKIKELNSQIEELKPYKENFEKAEKEKKVQELSSKYSKLLSEETFKSEKVQNAINELNTAELNNIVVEEVAKQKEKVETAEKDNKDILIAASKQGDLVTKDKHEYWASPSH